VETERERERGGDMKEMRDAEMGRRTLKVQGMSSRNIPSYRGWGASPVLSFPPLKPRLPKEI
jgi:hypothetical protein